MRTMLFAVAATLVAGMAMAAPPDALLAEWQGWR